MAIFEVAGRKVHGSKYKAARLEKIKGKPKAEPIVEVKVEKEPIVEESSIVEEE